MTDSEGHRLLRSQRNEIFTILQNRGFTPADFDLQEIDIGEQETAHLVHKTTGYYFQIRIRRFSTPPFQATYSPGSEFLNEMETCSTWPDVIINLESWLSFILKETEAPDLWDGLQGGNQLLQDATEQSSDHLPFTDAELLQIRECLKEIKSYVIKTKELTDTQRKIVDARFDHMEEVATRMGRKDWLTLLIGNLLGIAYNLALSGDSTRDLFGFAAIIIKKILGTMLYLSGPH